nr:hypothetical protein CFP56_68329 [Quercus suber]
MHFETCLPHSRESEPGRMSEGGEGKGNAEELTIRKPCEHPTLGLLTIWTRSVLTTDTAVSFAVLRRHVAAKPMQYTLLYIKDMPLTSPSHFHDAGRSGMDEQAWGHGAKLSIGREDEKRGEARSTVRCKLKEVMMNLSSETEQQGFGGSPSSSTFRLITLGADIRPQQAVSELLEYLGHKTADTGGPPYVLVAHSYGGCIARLYLQQHSRDVAGMVLVETGQETALSKDIEQEQYERQIMGSRPLVVVRGNTFLAKQRSHQEAVKAATSTLQHDQVHQQGRMLQEWVDYDEMLKKQQLRLSRNHRYVSLPDCGHHVIRDRPEVVVSQVAWVMEELSSKPLCPQQDSSRPGKRSWLRRLVRFVA